MDGDLDHCLFEISKNIEDHDGDEYQRISSISRISCPLSCHFMENSTRDKCSIEALEFDCPPFSPAHSPPLPNIRAPFLPPPLLIPSPSPHSIHSPWSEELYPKPPFIPILESPPSLTTSSPPIPPLTPPPVKPPTLQQTECQSSKGCEITPTSHIHAIGLYNQYMLYLIITLAALLILLVIIITWVVFKKDKKIKEVLTPQIETISV